jgi:ubiquitin-conjugating enzyme E2 Z
MTTQTVSSSTVKRLITDIKNIHNNPLSKDGIYYKHDETNMLVGYALIIGPADTPYAYGNFLFKFDFPANYPHSPPVVSYHMNDGHTRFHPNLYRNSKVCISVLNTWKGEQWTSCQTISSILLVLCSILDNMPLLNEPGITKKHVDIDKYNKIIEYRTISSSIYKLISGVLPNDIYDFFKDDIKENFIKNYENIIEKIQDKENQHLVCSIYGLQVKTHYNKLRTDLIKIHKNYID